jgi:Xaa-Pro aminopeptidase
MSKDNELKPYLQRRAELARRIGDGIAIIPTASEKARNRDSHYLYRFDSYFYYLTGFVEPESVLVLVGGRQPSSILFCRDRDPAREIWDGMRHGPKRARSAFGVDEARSIAELDQALPSLIANRPALHYPLGADPARRELDRTSEDSGS